MLLEHKFQQCFPFLILTIDFDFLVIAFIFMPSLRRVSESPGWQKQAVHRKSENIEKVRLLPVWRFLLTWSPHVTFLLSSSLRQTCSLGQLCMLPESFSFTDSPPRQLSVPLRIALSSCVLAVKWLTSKIIPFRSGLWQNLEWISSLMRVEGPHNAARKYWYPHLPKHWFSFPLGRAFLRQYRLVFFPSPKHKGILYPPFSSVILNQCCRCGPAVMLSLTSMPSCSRSLSMARGLVPCLGEALLFTNILSWRLCEGQDLSRSYSYSSLFFTGRGKAAFPWDQHSCWMLVYKPQPGFTWMRQRKPSDAEAPQDHPPSLVPAFLCLMEQKWRAVVTLNWNSVTSFEQSQLLTFHY